MDDGGVEGAGVVSLGGTVPPISVLVGVVSTGPPFVSPHAKATSTSKGDPLQIRSGLREQERGEKETAGERMSDVLAHAHYNGKPRYFGAFRKGRGGRGQITHPASGGRSLGSHIPPLANPSPLESSTSRIFPPHEESGHGDRGGLSRRGFSRDICLVSVRTSRDGQLQRVEGGGTRPD